MEIISFVGVGNIRFGMSPDEVKLLMSSPERQRLGKNGNLMESRGAISTIYSKEKRLQEVGFSRNYEELTYKNINILKDPRGEVLGKLLKLDAQVFESYGFLIFMGLGITLTGFHDSAEDDVAVTVFSKGVWSIDDELKPYLG